MPKRKAVTMWALACWRMQKNKAQAVYMTKEDASEACFACAGPYDQCTHSLAKVARRKPVRVKVEEC